MSLDSPGEVRKEGHKESQKGGQHERRQRARRRALQALYQWQITRQSADEILHQFQRVQDLSLIDEEFFANLLRGVIDQQQDLDRGLQVFLDRPMEQVDIMEQTVLRLGAWELKHCPEVPFRVVLDECIDLAHPVWRRTGTRFCQWCTG